MLLFCFESNFYQSAPCADCNFPGVGASNEAGARIVTTGTTVNIVCNSGYAIHQISPAPNTNNPATSKSITCNSGTWNPDISNANTAISCQRCQPSLYSTGASGGGGGEMGPVLEGSPGDMLVGKPTKLGERGGAKYYTRHLRELWLNDAKTNKAGSED